MQTQAPVTGSVRLVVEADRTIVEIKRQVGKRVVVTRYHAIRLQAHPQVATPPTWRLTKLREDGAPSETSYDLRLDRHGWHCDCADFTFRRQNAEKLCKHVEAMRAAQLLSREP